MLKVLLVDDEIITIRMLQNLINWKKLNLELVGYAEDGLKAVEMYLKYEPDIVISDIRMPNMTGIELVNKIKVINKDTAFILVTAFSDFAYISEAMKIGCSDYILKPIDEQELDESLKKVVEKIVGQNEQKEMIKKSRGQSRNYILQNFMKTGSDINTLINKQKDYPINFKDYRMLMVQLDYKTIDEYANMQHIESVKISYISHVIEGILDGYTHIIFDYEEDSWIILLADLTQEKLLSLSEELKAELKEQFEMNVVVCFSEVIMKLESLPHQFTKLKLLSRYSFYVESEEILGYGYNCNESKFNQIRGLDLLNEMDEALIENDRGKVNKILNEVFYLSKSISPSSLNMIYEIGYQTVLFIKKMIQDKSHPTEEMNTILQLTYEDLQSYKSVASFKRFMLEAVDAVLTKTDDPQEGYSDIVEQGIHLLKERFNENLSLETICEEISVSKNYFSYLFKREVGISVWTYLTELRLEKAKKLLKETKLKNYEISFQVGYENPSYFSMLFKNYETMTPSEYRKQNA